MKFVTSYIHFGRGTALKGVKVYGKAHKKIAFKQT